MDSKDVKTNAKKPAHKSIIETENSTSENKNKEPTSIGFDAFEFEIIREALLEMRISLRDAPKFLRLLDKVNKTIEASKK